MRVDAMDKETWGKASQEERTELIRSTINDFFDNPTLRSKINIWLPWARVSFPSADHKYSYEKFVKDKRIFLINRREKIKYFTTQRQVPQSFLPTKKEMIKQAQLKLASDWQKLVISQEATSKKKWMSSRDATWSHFNVRIQFKTAPRFSVWCEALDPIHRLCWKPVDLDSPMSSFYGHDLRLTTPCLQERRLKMTF